MTSTPSMSTARDIKPIYMNVRWLKGHERVDFGQAETSWAFGKRFSTKSSLLECIATHHIARGGTVFDLYSSRDGENLAWLRSPYRSVLLICGDDIDLDTKHRWIHISEFSLELAEQFDIVITTPMFYSDEYELNKALSAIVDLLKWRTTWKKVNFLMVREAARLLSSRIIAGRVKNAVEAEWDFIDLLREAYHTGNAIGIDSLRPMSIEVNIRELATYSFIVRMGKLHIPQEFNFLMRYVRPQFIRRMPLGKFILYTDSDNIAVGEFNKVPWHVERGENILNKVGVKIIHTTTKSVPMVDMKGKHKMTLGLHLKIIKLRNDGLAYEAIANQCAKEGDPISPATVRNECVAHKEGRCLCMA